MAFMSKDRNTFAKRQREVEKKRKADEKRLRRATKKDGGDETPEPSSPPDRLSAGELSVLGLFQRYLMTPGKMLCLTSADMQAFHKPLAQLTTRGMLVAESHEGGYSLTESGFAAMQEAA